MARYIDTDDFINYIRTLSIWSKTYEVEALKSLNGLLNQIPTADVRENVKGKWISDRLITTSGGTYGVKRCSNCEHYYQDVVNEWNYCPNCGADMRGEV